VALTDTARPAVQETTLAMKQAIERLAPLDRDVFLLRELVGLAYAEIAESCEISVDAVRARLHHARTGLRRELEPVLRNGRIPHVRLYDPR
jgi:RNA polymerase sigma-70 factor (ECF subfamily)